MHKKLIPIIITFLLFPTITKAQEILTNPLSDRITEYNIKIKLDTETKKLTGEMILKGKNPSQDTVRDLQFHMYLNAFKNDKSTMMSEGSKFLKKEEDRGWVEIESIIDPDGLDLTPGMRYLQPDQAVDEDNLRLPQEKP